MKYMRQFGIILGVTCAGELMKYFIPLPIPGSIYGLLLMFVLLLTKVIKVENVKDVGEFLIEIMPLMFIPAGVGLMASWGELQGFLIPLLVIFKLSSDTGNRLPCYSPVYSAGCSEKKCGCHYGGNFIRSGCKYGKYPGYGHGIWAEP